MRKGLGDKRRLRQEKGALEEKERIERDKERCLLTLEHLQDVKEVMDMKSGAGKRLMLSIIKDTDILGEPFTNSGHTAYNLGVRSVGNKLLKMIISAGCELNVMDLSDSLNINTVNDIYKEINRLDEEGKTK